MKLKTIYLITYRGLNPHITQHKTKMENLKAVEHQIVEGCFFATFDISNCYFHVRLNPKHRKYFGFKITTEDDLERYFIFLVMCYGYSAASEVISRLTRPLKTLIHRLGITFCIYIGVLF